MTRPRPIRQGLFAAALCLLAGCAAQRQPAVAVQPPAAEPPTPEAPAPAAPPVSRDERATASTPHRTVALIGDSTTYGTPPPKQGLQSPYNPGATLETLLAHLEPMPADGGTPWRGARVYNLAVGGSSTPLWLANPPFGCNTLFELFPIVKTACATHVSWAKAVPFAVEGGHVDAAIVDLGINDILVTTNPVEVVDRLVQIRAALAPIPVLFYPPIAPQQGPRGDWPRRVRTEMEKRGLFSEAQYPFYVPTFDGLHPTAGGYAAMGGLWLDGLRTLP